MINASGLGSNEDGILGMWSGNHSSADTSEMLMTQMAADSDITEQTFSYYLTGLSGQSYLDFGTPNTSVMDGSPIYISINSENYWWASDLTGFRWSNDSSNEYAISSGNYGITDTGSSCIVGPSEEADVIVRNIVSNLDKVYTDDGWGYIFTCPTNESDLPSFEFLYGGYWFEVLPEDYLIDISAAGDGSWCALCITSISGFHEWILGDAFMRGFYNIHDHANLRMGFVPFTGSSKSVPETATTTPTGSIPDVTLTNVGTLIFGIPATTFLIIVGLLLTVTCCCTACVVYCFFGRIFSQKSSVLARGKKILEKSAAKAGCDSESQISLIYLQ